MPESRSIGLVYFCILAKMFRYFQILLFALLTGFFFVACSDDTEGVEYKFDRETSEITVLRQCAEDADSGAYCFQIRFRVPIDTVDLDSFYVWVDTTVVGDTAKSVSNTKLKNATAVFPFGHKSNYETIDLTPYIQEFVEEGRDSLMVGLFSGYSGDHDPGSIQRVYLHFGDDLDPSVVNFFDDSTWTTGAQFNWYRPSDQTDYYKPGVLNGPIAGYNIVIRAENEDEDIRDLKVTVITADETDSTGDKLYMRHSRINTNSDSMWIASVEHGDSRKNELRLLILDGLGIDTADNERNHFRLVIEGLKAESGYTRGLVAYDSAGNYSGIEGASSDLFKTTDSIAPLMATKIFTIKDTLFPEKTRLDSNNHVRIFWNKSVDPVVKNHGIKVDSVLTIPSSCLEESCYKDSVASYVVDYYDAVNKKWIAYTYAGGTERYTKRYAFDGDSLMMDPDGNFVTDTIRWVAPGDTLIIRIRAKDVSGYYSKALVDTVVVSPGVLATQVDCPSGFVPVKTDSSVFCMEKYEHRDARGSFVSNVLHSEAIAACEAISASGFTVSLCGERDWQQVCLSGGTLTYGVIEEESLSAAEFLFSNCNVSTGYEDMAMDVSLRNPNCVSPMGIRDFPGNLQEWVKGRSEDTLAVLKGGSYMVFDGLDRESRAMCTTRSFPFYTRPAYTQDTVYLYREGTRVDTVFAADTSRTAYEDKPFLTVNDFTDSLQFFTVKNSNGDTIGEDYALYSEYKKGGDEWLKELSNGLVYEPSRIEVVFIKNETVAYRQAAAFYKSPSIGFRCCAYPE